MTITDLLPTVERPSFSDVAADAYIQLDDLHNMLLSARPVAHDRQNLSRALSAVRDAKDALYRTAVQS